MEVNYPRGLQETSTTILNLMKVTMLFRKNAFYYMKIEQNVKF